MIKNLSYNTIKERNNEVLSYLASKTKKPTVIDVGASYDPWCSEFTIATVDLNKTASPGTTQFYGDINNIDVWNEILSYVGKNGKFDFCVCTHTLEDISNPIFVSKMISQVAKEGFIAVPSKFVESKRNGGLCRGWLHHRWIFNNEDDIVVAYPKLPFTEYLTCLDELAANFTEETSELSFFWEGTCDIQVVNEDFFPSDDFALNIYNKLL
jgi:hypothetical protein